jgi:quercetin dioxygenase-like cupin family protein
MKVRQRMKRTTTRAVCVTVMTFGLTIGTLAMTQQASSTTSAHVMVAPADVKWGDGPPSLPAGAKAAVLEGDPAKAGLFTLRLQMPANYRIPAHWHPADEHVTVLSGTFHMGLGDKLDEAKAKPLTAGSFALMPPKTNHFAFTKAETVIQLHGMGPWGITYVNPADDPRKK